MPRTPRDGGQVAALVGFAGESLIKSGRTRIVVTSFRFAATFAASFQEKTSAESLIPQELV